MDHLMYCIKYVSDGTKLKKKYCKVNIYTALIFMSLCPVDVSKKLVSDAKRNQHKNHIFRI